MMKMPKGWKERKVMKLQPSPPQKQASHQHYHPPARPQNMPTPSPKKKLLDVQKTPSSRKTPALRNISPQSPTAHKSPKPPKKTTGRLPLPNLEAKTPTETQKDGDTELPGRFQPKDTSLHHGNESTRSLIVSWRTAPIRLGG